MGSCQFITVVTKNGNSMLKKDLSIQVMSEIIANKFIQIETNDWAMILGVILQLHEEIN